MTGKRDIEKRLDALEGELTPETLADLSVGEIYMVMLRANEAGNTERERRVWNEYQRRVKELAAETEAEDAALDGDAAGSDVEERVDADHAEDDGDAGDT